MSTATLDIEKRKTLVPELRFKEFEGEFHSKIFDEITEITRLAGYEYSQYWKEDVKGEIIALRGYNIGKGKLDLIKLAYISNELSLQLKRSRLFKGDIVYPCVGSIGNAVVIEEDDKFHIQQNIAKISCKKGVSPYFIVQFLVSDFGMNEVYRFNASGAQPNVLVGSLRKYKINLPTLTEQQKIASFLSAVDEKIQQLTRKKELLEQYKKGVMQQLFSGKLRFKDENGEDYPDWEEKKLGEVLKIGSGKDYKHLQNGNVPVFGTGGYMLSVNKFLHSGETVFIGRKGTIDKPFYFKGDFWTVDTLFYTHTFKNVIPKFIYCVFQQINWKLHNEASGVPSLSKSTIEKLKFNFPCVSEQQKVANFLSSIDDKIESTNQQITQTQTFKKGLLQQMFV